MSMALIVIVGVRGTSDPVPPLDHCSGSAGAEDRRPGQIRWTGQGIAQAVSAGAGVVGERSYT
jgi:hypothetical protein